MHLLFRSSHYIISSTNEGPTAAGYHRRRQAPAKMTATAAVSISWFYSCTSRRHLLSIPVLKFTSPRFPFLSADYHFTDQLSVACVQNRRNLLKIAAAMMQGEVETETEVAQAEVMAPLQNTKLYFGNLPYNCDIEQLTGVIQEHASPEMIEVLYDKETRRSRGFAVVTMSSIHDYEAAMSNLNGFDPGKYQNALNFMAYYLGSDLQCRMCGFSGRRQHFKLLKVPHKASLIQGLQTLFSTSLKKLSSYILSFQRKVQKMTCWKEKFIISIGTIFSFVVVSMMAIISTSLTVSKDTTWALTEENRLFLEAWRTVDRAYFDKTFNGKSWFRYRENALRNEPMNNREETYMAIKKMLSTLDDPFTRFLEPEKFKILRSGTQGALTGVGLSIGYPTGLDLSSAGLVVISTSPGGPANKIGIKPGDVIVAIDDRSTEDMDIYEAAELLQGTEGSTVKLDIHSGPEIKQMALRREKITLNPVKLRLCEVLGQGNDSSRIGYIKLTSFNQNTSGAVRDAIESLRGSGVKFFVLDLRDNSGGLFAEGIETAKIWLEKGVIVYICDSRGVRDIYETDGSNAIAASEPLIVLVNRGTASASEILAGALKDNKRAVLYGEPTFGKGKIQSVFELSDGSGLAVTVARYETPGHTDIDKVGIIPDRTLPPSFPLDEDSFCSCLKDPASACNLDTAALFSR